MSVDALIAQGYQLYQAIGKSLDTKQQIFVSEHYKGLVDFVSSDAGKKAVNDFVNAWRNSK